MSYIIITLYINSNSHGLCLCITQYIDCFYAAAQVLGKQCYSIMTKVNEMC